MSFLHKKYFEFYRDYAIKTNMLMDETYLNLYQTRLKKEVQDNYNRFQVFVGNLSLEWSQIEKYEVGELVSYDNKNWECLVNSYNNEPTTSPNYWKEVTSSDISKNSFKNYLAKDNQEEYDPSLKGPLEKTADYHPSTKKYVDDSINYAFNNRKAQDSDRLDGHDSTYFASQNELDNVKQRYVKKEEVIDNLKSTVKDLPLSANQGNVIRKELDKILALLKSNDVSLDELQEIVDFIKANREKIDTLGIDQVKGLRNYLNNLDTVDTTLVPKDWWNFKFLDRIKEVDGSGSGIDADLLDGRDSTYFMAKSDFNPNNILQLLKDSDGSGSLLDADMLDGLDSTSFLRRDASDEPSQDNVFNLGSANNKWNSIYASNFIGVALRAKYADLSEIYETDKEFQNGDIIGIENGEYVIFNEKSKYIGVITTNPAVVLNENKKGINIALKGQTPVKAKNVKKGQYVIAGFDGIAYGVDDYSFNESKRFIGIAISDTIDGFCNVKI